MVTQFISSLTATRKVWGARDGQDRLFSLLNCQNSVLLWLWACQKLLGNSKTSKVLKVMASTPKAQGIIWAIVFGTLGIQVVRVWETLGLTGRTKAHSPKADSHGIVWQSLSGPCIYCTARMEPWGLSRNACRLGQSTEDRLAADVCIHAQGR